MKHSQIINIQHIRVFLFFLFITHAITSQSKNSIDSLRLKSNVDSLKIDLSIFNRRDVSSYRHYSNLLTQDSINYKIPADTILGRVRMFKLTINQKTSLGNYKNSVIKNVRLEYKCKNNVLHIENEKQLRPIQDVTLWSGKSNKKPQLINEIDQVLIVLTTENGNRFKDSKYIVNF